MEKLGGQGQEKVGSAKIFCFESLRVQTYCRYSLPEELQHVVTELLVVKLVIMQKIKLFI